MARYYTDAEMARRYEPGETIRFSRGAYVFTAEKAHSFTYGLVELDRETGKYRRASPDPGLETMMIREALLRDQLRAGGAPSSPSFSGNRLRS